MLPSRAARLPDVSGEGLSGPAERVAATSPPGHRADTRWQHAASIIGAVLVCAAFSLNVQRMLTLGMDAVPPRWVLFAIPPALSDVVFGHRVRYTTLAVIHERYISGLNRLPANADGIDAIMQEIASLDPAMVGTEYILLSSDDKGIVDFIALAFRVFGLNTRGITWLYILLQAISCALLVIAARRHPTILASLAALLMGQYLVLPMVTFNPQLGSLLALRALPALTLAACLHAVYFVLRPSRRAVDLALVVAQIGLIVYTTHLRSTTEWQAAVIVLASIGRSPRV